MGMELNMDIWFGWTTCYIDPADWMPTDEETGYKASCFVLFTHIIWVGEIKRI